MIEKIQWLIEEIYQNKNYKAYEDLEYYLYLFRIQLAKKQSDVDKSEANMNMAKAEYQIQNRKKYNSDRTASSHFKKDNAEKINKLEILQAEAQLLSEYLKAFDRFANYFKSDEIRGMVIAKRTQ